MSTFKGVVEEFRSIRIDYFRKIKEKPKPLACFLSHVHSDHLQGLDSFHTDSDMSGGACFIYCSPTTRELMLRLEKYSHRMNFHRGVLEYRKQHYSHLEKKLKTIALNSPTEVELSPGQSIRVTLLDANHCAGAVMFLIENESKAILYTGDIRSEPWWVNSLIRNPVILPYTHGLKHLDKIYLDTTFASKKNQCRRFPTKADGLKELLEKISKYPPDTVFHLHAWTFGYEDVWIALSSALKSQIHVDDYKYSLYESLGNTFKKLNFCHEGSALYGFEFGNRFQDGCLTRKQNVRLHSCQQDMGCSALEASNIVYIRPIVSRSDEGRVLPELGAGGGAGDLNKMYELELNDAAVVENLIEFCKRVIPDQETRLNTIDLIDRARKTQKLVVSIDTLDENSKTIPLEELAKLLAKLAVGDEEMSKMEKSVGGAKTLGKCPVRQQLARRIEFPYSRHSSYEELCDLVRAFKPVDVYPCTIDEGYIDLSVSIASLFGHLCFGSTFAHDKEMELFASQQKTLKRSANDRDSQSMTSPRERSVDQRGTNPVSLLGSASDPKLDALGNLKRVPKRQRTNPAVLRNHEDDFPLENKTTEAITPRRKLPDFGQSFKSNLIQMKRETALPGPKSPFNSANDDMVMSQTAIVAHPASSAAPDLNDDPNANTIQKGYSADRPVGVHHGTQAALIELSDGDPSSQGNEAGDFLLEEMPEPKDIPNTLIESQLGVETQVTLPDAAFESQSLHDSDAVRLQQRKEAYRAAKEPGGIWGIDHGLISSHAHHGEEEFEL